MNRRFYLPSNCCGPGSFNRGWIDVLGDNLRYVGQYNHNTKGRCIVCPAYIQSEWNDRSLIDVVKSFPIVNKHRLHHNIVFPAMKFDLLTLYVLGDLRDRELLSICQLKDPSLPSWLYPFIDMPVHVPFQRRRALKPHFRLVA